MKRNHGLCVALGLAHAGELGMLHRETMSKEESHPMKPHYHRWVDPPKWAEPIKTRSGGFWDGHWIGFLFLVPFVCHVRAP